MHFSSLEVLDICCIEAYQSQKNAPEASSVVAKQTDDFNLIESDFRGQDCPPDFLWGRPSQKWPRSSVCFAARNYQPGMFLPSYCFLVSFTGWQGERSSIMNYLSLIYDIFTIYTRYCLTFHWLCTILRGVCRRNCARPETWILRKYEMMKWLMASLLFRSVPALAK